MSEQSSQEPTMEEILASIRRIISEDEAPAEAGPVIPEAEPTSAKPAAEFDMPESEPSISGSSDPTSTSEYEPAFDAEPQLPPLPDLDDEEDGDLELTQKVETHGDLDVLAPEPDPEPEAVPPPIATLVSDEVAAQAAATFGQLHANMLMPAHGRTLEDVVREMLNPLLKSWLDTYLPDIVQQAVQAEVERIARGRVR